MGLFSRQEQESEPSAEAGRVEIRSGKSMSLKHLLKRNKTSQADIESGGVVVHSDQLDESTELNRPATSGDEQRHNGGITSSLHNSDITTAEPNGCVVIGNRDPAASERSSVENTAADDVPKSEGNKQEAMLNFEGDYDDAFWNEVSHKEKIEGLPHKTAVQEARLDRLVTIHGTVEKALLWVLQQCPMQGETIRMLSGMLPRGVDLKKSEVLEELGATALHVAAERNFFYVAHGLLIYDKDAPLDKRGASGKLPVEVAMDNGYDKIAALMIKSMDSASVRAMFERNADGTTPRSLQSLLKTKEMTETSQAIMDACIEPTGEPDELRFHFSLLEGDRHCHVPSDDDFSYQGATAYQKAISNPDKAVRQHALVRMLTYEKWSSYGEKLALAKLIFYLAFLFAMSFSLISASRQDNPAVYDSAEDYARGVFEVVSLLIVLYQLWQELNQIKRIHLEYFRYTWNYIRVLSGILLLTVVPLRFTEVCAQWHVASLAFALLWIRVLELISITRFVGIYMQMLSRILVKDVSRFLVVFLAVLITYSGSLVLALRGERWTGGEVEDQNSTDPQLVTELGITRIASTFGAVLLTGFRSMAQQENLLDYISEDGAENSYSWLGIIINILFLFFLLVVLLNILIAQLSDTYAEVQGDAQHELEQNWADSIKLLEQEGGDFVNKLRKQNYKPSKTVLEPGDLLRGWECEVAEEGGDDKADQERRQLKMEQQIERQSERIESLSFQLKLAVDILRHMDEETTPRLLKNITQIQEETLPNTVNQAMKENVEAVNGHVQQLQQETSQHINTLGTEISPEKVEGIVSASLQSHMRPLCDVIDHQQRQLDEIPTRGELIEIVRDLLAERQPPPPARKPQRTLLTTLLGSGAAKLDESEDTSTLSPPQLRESPKQTPTTAPGEGLEDQDSTASAAVGSEEPDRGVEGQRTGSGESSTPSPPAAEGQRQNLSILDKLFAEVEGFGRVHSSQAPEERASPDDEEDGDNEDEGASRKKSRRRGSESDDTVSVQGRVTQIPPIAVTSMWARDDSEQDSDNDDVNRYADLSSDDQEYGTDPVRPIFGAFRSRSKEQKEVTDLEMENEEPAESLLQRVSRRLRPQQAQTAKMPGEQASETATPPTLSPVKSESSWDMLYVSGDTQLAAAAAAASADAPSDIPQASDVTVGVSADIRTSETGSQSIPSSTRQLHLDLQVNVESDNYSSEDKTPSPI